MVRTDKRISWLQKKSRWKSNRLIGEHFLKVSIYTVTYVTKLYCMSVFFTVCQYSVQSSIYIYVVRQCIEFHYYTIEVYHWRSQQDYSSPWASLSLFPDAKMNLYSQSKVALQPELNQLMILFGIFRSFTLNAKCFEY